MPRAILREERRRAFRILYEAGWSDGAIARVIDSSQPTVARWRHEEALPANPSRYDQKIDNQIALSMHEDGMSDGAIARHFGATQSGVTRWRQRRGLTANEERTAPLAPAEVRAAKSMLKLGATKRQVASAMDRCSSSIRRIRRGMKEEGLRRTGLTNRAIRSQVLRDKSLYPRIQRALGRNLPQDVLQDAADELYLAVLDGLIAERFIEEQAPRFRNRAFAMNGSNFGPRSLDARDDDGWSLGDSLGDPCALEEMELAAEAAYGNDNW